MKDKYDIVKKFEAGGITKAELARQYDMCQSALHEIIAQTEKIKEAVEIGNIPLDRKGFRTPHYPDLDKAMLKWYKENEHTSKSYR